LSARFFRGDLELAKEAWNDALFRVWSRIEAYDEKRSRFRTWLWNQARYAALDLFRRPWEGREEPFAGEERSKRDERGRLIGDPLHRALDAEAQRLVEDPEPLLPHEIAALRSAWSRLNEPEQRLLHYRYLVGLEPVEIARRGLAGREIPAEHLRVYVNRAAGRMRRFYEEELAAYFGESGGQEVRQNG
jgi:RNA polymerase sigma factor (sigma-70 family)